MQNAIYAIPNMHLNWPANENMYLFAPALIAVSYLIFCYVI